MMLIPLARQRDEGVPRGPGDPPHQISRRSVFHGISRAERPSQQSRKTNPGSRSGKPGTDGTASEFPAKSAGNPWESDRKSTRLNSSHLVISYAVFCLKK